MQFQVAKKVEQVHLAFQVLFIHEYLFKEPHELLEAANSIWKASHVLASKLIVRYRLAEQPLFLEKFLIIGLAFLLSCKEIMDSTSFELIIDLPWDAHQVGVGNIEHLILLSPCQSDAITPFRKVSQVETTAFYNWCLEMYHTRHTGSCGWEPSNLGGRSRKLRTGSMQSSFQNNTLLIRRANLFAMSRPECICRPARFMRNAVYSVQGFV